MQSVYAACFLAVKDMAARLESLGADWAIRVMALCVERLVQVCPSDFHHLLAGPQLEQSKNRVKRVIDLPPCDFLEAVGGHYAY